MIPGKPNIIGLCAKFFGMNPFFRMTVFVSVVMVANHGCGLGPDISVQPSVITLASQGQIDRGEVVPNSYIVAFRTKQRPLSLTFTSFLAESKFYHRTLDADYLADPRVKSMRYIDTLDLSDPGDDIWHSELEPPPTLQLAWDSGRLQTHLATLVEVEFSSQPGTLSLFSEWSRNGELWFAEPNYYNNLLGTFGDLKTAYDTAGGSGPIWWHEMINLPQALQNLEERDTDRFADDDNVRKPVIAVLDSGLDVDHPSLAPEQVWQNSSPGASDCGNDVNGCDTSKAAKGILGVGTVTPFAFQAGQGCPGGAPTGGVAPSKAPETRSACKHGTHIAGIIAGKVASNNVGGACPVCQIMTVRIIGDTGKAADAAILNGLKYVLRFKKKGSDSGLVRIVNASFGKYTRARAVALVVNALKKSPNEVLVVGAASNEDSMVRAYPAALNDALAVSSVGPGGQKAYYSNFGPWVDIAAPGGDQRATGGGGQPGDKLILSTVPDDAFEVSQGTSMAAPVVAGIAGLILAVDPGRSWTDLRRSLIDTADCKTLYQSGTTNSQYFPKIGGDPQPRPLLGSGLLDAAEAIEGKKNQSCPFAGLDRVNRGCSTIALGSPNQAGPTSMTLIPWAFLVLPCLVVMIGCRGSIRRLL